MFAASRAAALALSLFTCGAGLSVLASPAEAAPSTCTRWLSSTTPPDTIRVGLVSAGAVVTVPFREYVRDTLPNEWVTSWRPAALQAGAVAVKQYAWYYAMNTGHGGTIGGQCYDVTDNTASQVYKRNSRQATTDAAIDATWGVTLTRGGALFPTQYVAGSSGQACGVAVPNYPDRLSQYGSQTCAGLDRNYADILTLYYANVQLVQAGAGAFAGMARTPSGGGYYLVTRDGAVRPHGSAPTFGDARGQSYFAGQTVAALVTTASGNGYWILSEAGGVYAYGDAPHFGAAAGQSYFAGQRAVSLVPNAAGNGYWIMSAAGGIYSYGGAAFFGAAAGQSYFSGQTATGMTRSPGGNGYWIMSAAGGVYAYGDAPHFGAAAGQSYFNGQRAVALTASASGRGYWILSAAGGVYAYGDAPHFGAAAGQSYFNGQTATGLTRSASGNGYWICAASGGIYTYGDAPFYGAA
ncbi:SpoIID/LytB domain-containing protein [Actinoplanes sp. NPDC004185]